eukprot:jgi/Chlat1/5726/Chrsp38S05558
MLSLARWRTVQLVDVRLSIRTQTPRCWCSPRRACSAAMATSTGDKHASAISPGTSRIGWIGTGVMGQSMCGHIMNAGYSVNVYNRTMSKAQSLVEKGAAALRSPRLVAERSNVVFTIVGYPQDVREVILGNPGVLAGLRPGGVVVDMTTSDPALAREIAEAALATGCQALDCPVSGGDVGARNASLAIMAGGDYSTVKALLPLLSLMGNTTYLGLAGSGQSCKLANQVTIASTMVGMVEGLLYASKAGLNPETYLQAISGGAAGSKSLTLYASRILNRDFQPGFIWNALGSIIACTGSCASSLNAHFGHAGFFVKHFVKDLGIALEESRKMNLSLPGLALAQQLYVALMAHGDGDLGTQALMLALERLNNTTLSSKP